MMLQEQQVELVTIPERHVAGIARDYTMQTRHEIGDQWQAFFETNPQIDRMVEGAMFGVSFGADGEGAFRYAVGVEVDPAPDTLPEGVCGVTLSSGTYAVLRRFAPLVELPATFDWMFSKGLPGSGLTQREGAVFERYPDDSRNGPDGMVWEIWVPVDKPG